MSDDYYKILGVNKTSSEAEIKKAYKKLAIKWHPDKNLSNKERAEQEFKKITEAYAVLSDKEKKQQYDRFGKAGLNNSGPRQNDPFNMFNSMFGGRSPFGNFNVNFSTNNSRVRRKGKSVFCHHSYTLEDLYKKKKISLSFSREKLCVKCKGLGVTDSKYVDKCSNCNGSGMVSRTVQLGPGIISQTRSPCGVCQQTGEILNSKYLCSHCNGKKVVKKKESITVDCPNKLKHGDKATIKGLGNEVKDGISGDLTIQFMENKHKIFQRVGDNLVIIKTITLLESLTGYRFNFKHLDGRVIGVIENNIIEPNQVNVIKGEGINGASIYIIYKVVYPKKLPKEAKAILKKILPTSENVDFKKEYIIGTRKASKGECPSGVLNLI